MDLREVDCSAILKFPSKIMIPLPGAKWWRFGQRRTEGGGRKRGSSVLCRPRGTKRVSSTVLASPPLSRPPKQPLLETPTHWLLGFEFHVGFPRRPGTNILAWTSHPTPGFFGTPYLPSPARSCIVLVRVATGEEAATRSGDPRRP